MTKSYYEQICQKQTALYPNGVRIPLMAQILRQVKQMELKQARKRKKVATK